MASSMSRQLQFLQETHISNRLGENSLDNILNVRVIVTWDSIRYLHPRVVEMLDRAGFYGVYRCGTFQLDHHLITALVERWRRETHTFHLVTGEATVTLEDVAVIWQLPVDGLPLIEPTADFLLYPQLTWETVATLIGWSPNHDDDPHPRGFYLKLHDIAYSLQATPVTKRTSQEKVCQWTRGFILLMLGGTLLGDASQSTVPARWLQYLDDLDMSGKYSWGGAVLAHLYRELCAAANGEKKSICGPLHLLQTWAWSRIPGIRPELNVSHLPDLGALQIRAGQFLPAAPWGARYF